MKASGQPQVLTFLVSFIGAVLIFVVIHYLLTGHIHPEPTLKGVYTLELMAVILLFAAYASGEVAKLTQLANPHARRPGLKLKDVCLIFLTLLSSLSILLAVRPFFP